MRLPKKLLSGRVLVCYRTLAGRVQNKTATRPPPYPREASSVYKQPEMFTDLCRPASRGALRDAAYECGCASGAGVDVTKRQRCECCSEIKLLLRA